MLLYKYFNRLQIIHPLHNGTIHSIFFKDYSTLHSSKCLQLQLQLLQQEVEDEGEDRTPPEGVYLVVVVVAVVLWNP